MKLIDDVEKNKLIDFDLLCVLIILFLTLCVLVCETDIFNEFKDGKGNFKDNLIDDVEGLLSLYEASFLGGHGEDTLDKALYFCKTHLESAVAHLVSPLADKVSRALKRPLLKGVPKHEQWHHILIYQQDEACPGAVLKLAKLDFNVLQKCYQDELRIISR